MDVPGTDRGVSLIETMIAVVVALIGVFSIGSLIFQATVTNKNQGTEVTRATIYAQDKMEKLLSLSFSTCNQGVTTNPSACDTANITGTGWNTGLVAGGQLNTGDPNAPMQSTCPTSGASLGYVDFLDNNGAPLPATAGACSTVTTSSIAYVRMWQIQDVCVSTSPANPAGCVGGPVSGPFQKQITVAVWSQAAIGQGTQAKPVVMVTSYLSNSGTCGSAELTAGCQM